MDACFDIRDPDLNEGGSGHEMLNTHLTNGDCPPEIGVTERTLCKNVDTNFKKETKLTGVTSHVLSIIADGFLFITFCSTVSCKIKIFDPQVE